MIQRAQDVMKLVQDRFRSTLRVMADLAQSAGLPPLVTSFLQSFDGRQDAQEVHEPTWSREPISPARPTWEAAPPPAATPAAPQAAAPEKKRPAGKKKGLAGVLEEKVRQLDVDDAISGSTYLARIIWCLGVSDLEGTGPLRPADIARMVMSRSAVSLEPPNVARYIRRSKPTCIAVDHEDGGSNFYTLNAEGQALFDATFRLDR